MMAPKVAKMIFCHLPVLQCGNFIHYVLSLVHWDLFLIGKTNEISTFFKCNKNILSSILAPILAPFEAFWDHLGAILGPLGAILGPLGAILGPFGAILGPLGAILVL